MFRREFILLTIICILLSGKITATIYYPNRVLQIEAGYQHAFVILDNGSLWSWGSNAWGELGLTSNGVVNRQGDAPGLSMLDVNRKTTPHKVMDDVAKVSAGYQHSLSLKNDGSLWAFGNGGWGQLGDGRWRSRWIEGQEYMDSESLFDTSVYIERNIIVLSNSPLHILDDVRDMAAGFDFSIAVKNDGSVWYWGFGYTGEGDNMGITTMPHSILASGAKAVAAGRNYVLLLMDDGTLWAKYVSRPEYVYGETGITSDDSHKGFMHVLDNVSAITVSRAGFASMAIRDDHTLWVWGLNKNGNLGLGTTENCPFPIKVMDNVQKMAVSDQHGYAVTKDGILHIAGLMAVDGKDHITFSPFMNGVVDIAAGAEYLLVKKENGSLWNWGFTNEAPLADVTVSDFISQEIPIIEVAYGPLDSASSWARETMEAMRVSGRTPECLQSHYASNIKRGEFCQLIVKHIELLTGQDIGSYLAAHGLTIQADTFTDTADSIILSVHALNIVHGLDNNRFDPDGWITREQAAAMLRNFCIAMSITASDVSENVFEDNDSISPWAASGVNYVTQIGLMRGTGNNRFDPKGGFTREQAIATFFRLQETIS